MLQNFKKKHKIQDLTGNYTYSGELLTANNTYCKTDSGLCYLIYPIFSINSNHLIIKTINENTEPDSYVIPSLFLNFVKFILLKNPDS